MNKFFKTIFTILSILLFSGALYGLTKATLGNYFLNSPFTGVLMVIGVVVLGYILVKGNKAMWKYLVLILSTGFLTTVTSCQKAKANQSVVFSSDCGQTWSKVNSGDAVPISGVNTCFLKYIIPNFPMQGEAIFVANLKGKVKVKATLDYDYSIVEPLLFIREAKYLGSANKDADSNEALDASAFEAAENRVIDKRIKDISKEVFNQEDIVEMDQDAVEARLEDKFNEVLKKYGIKLNFITLVFEPDEQTNQAIDVSVAMRIYDSRGLGELGKRIIEAKAGAAKITTVVNQPTVKKEEE